MNDTGARWKPTAAHLAGNQIGAFIAATGLQDRGDLDRLAADDPAEFWDAVTRWLDFDWQRPYTDVADDRSLPEATRWFVGGEFNLADNAVDRWIRRGRGDCVAIRWSDAENSRGSWSYNRLAAEVDRVAAGLRGLGVSAGDRVSIQLPMIVEAIVASLACAKIGAISIPVFSGFAAEAVATRVGVSGAIVHITADGYLRRGKRVDLRSVTTEVLVRCPAVRTVVEVPVLGDRSVDHDRTIDWASFPTVAPFPAERLPADHPLLIAYTSGTTGVPKGVVLGHAGFAVKAASDVRFSFDARQSDTLTWATDPGWIMGPIFSLGGLLAGSSVAALPLVPDYPDSRALWRAAQEAGVTLLGLSPSLVRLLERVEDDPSSIDLGRIRLFASSGEAWTPEAWEWLFTEAGGGDVPIINYSGGTEVSGAILSNTVSEPIVSCGFAGPMPGMGAEIRSADGAPVAAGVGELALRHASPGMPLTFWNDPDRYHETYWSRWPGLWYHGDWVGRDDDGTWFIYGRSDDTLKVAGKRIGPAEVEAVANGIEGVHESAVIGVPSDSTGEALVVFVAVGAGEPDLHPQVSQRIVEAFGPALRPQSVHLVVALPRNRSGKVLRRLVRQAYLGLDLGDTSSLESVEPLSAISRARG